MGKDDEGGTKAGADDGVDRRQASLLLSSLVLTPDSSLEVYRQRRAADGALDLEHLRRTRDILEQLSLAIRSTEPERWRRVARAWAALCQDAPVVSAAASTAQDAPTARQSAASSEVAEPQAKADEAVPAPAPPPAVPAPPPIPLAPARPPPIKRARPPVAPVSEPHPPPAAPEGSSPWAASAAPSAPAARSSQPEQPGEPPDREVAGADVAAHHRGKLDEAEPAPVSVDDDKPAEAAPPPEPEQRDPLAETTTDARGLEHAASSALPFRTHEPAEVASTATDVTDRSEAADGALPFRKGDAKPPPRVAVSAEQDKPTDLGGTVAVETMSPLAGMILPFERQAPPAEPSPLQPAPAANAEPAAAGPASARGSQASDSSASRAAGPLPAAADSDDAAPPELPDHLREMSVEQYAALCAECAVHTNWVTQILARYHVRSAAERASLDAFWRVRMAADAELTQQFRWHYARYEQWAKQQGR